MRLPQLLACPINDTPMNTKILVLFALLLCLVDTTLSAQRYQPSRQQEDRHTVTGSGSSDDRVYVPTASDFEEIYFEYMSPSGRGWSLRVTMNHLRIVQGWSTWNLSRFESWYLNSPYYDDDWNPNGQMGTNRSSGASGSGTDPGGGD